MSNIRKHSSFRLDPKVKSDFRDECEFNCVDMTETIESFMKAYIRINKEKRNERQNS